MTKRRIVFGIAAALALAAVPGRAHAGRQLFTWSLDTETLPERGVELEQWVSERTGDDETGTKIWWGPIVGITDKLEVALPIQLGYKEAVPPATSDVTNFTAWGVDVRYRLVSADPVTAPRFVPLVRVSVDRLVQVRGDVKAQLDAVVSGDFDRVHAVLDMGTNVIGGDVGKSTVNVLFGGGASVRLIDDLHAGVEIFGQKTVRSAGDTDFWITAGPCAAWTHGRFWITGTFLIGLGDKAPTTLPRVIWGVLF